METRRLCVRYNDMDSKRALSPQGRSPFFIRAALKVCFRQRCPAFPERCPACRAPAGQPARYSPGHRPPLPACRSCRCVRAAPGQRQAMVPARAANVLPGLCPALFPGPAGVAAGWPAADAVLAAVAAPAHGQTPPSLHGKDAPGGKGHMLFPSGSGRTADVAPGKGYRQAAQPGRRADNRLSLPDPDGPMT